MTIPPFFARRFSASLVFFVGGMLVIHGCSSGDKGSMSPEGAGGTFESGSGGEMLGTGGRSPEAASGGGDGSGVGSGGAETSAGGQNTGGAMMSSSGGAATEASGGGPSATGGGPAVDPTCSAGQQTGAPKVLALSGNTFAHDPTMIKVGDTYYRFWTGDFIPSSVSTNLTQWSNAQAVYKNSYPAWVGQWLSGIPGQTFNFPWAPDVSQFDDKVHIYSSFSAKFGDNISCITHLTTEDIAAGNWTDHGPVICTQGNEKYNAIDADVGFDAEGNPYLAFGSFWDGIEMIPLNTDGSRKGDSMTRLAWANEIEAPVLFRRCDYYYLFVTWGICCPGENRKVSDLTYRVAVGRADNISGPYVDRNGKPMREGGGTLIVQGDGTNFAAAGHSDVLVDGEKIYHLYHAYAAGTGNASLRIAELFFDDEGWPVPHAP